VESKIGMWEGGGLLFRLGWENDTLVLFSRIAWR
jgi:hypothetical protein